MRRYRLVVDDGGAEGFDVQASAVVECAACGDELLLSGDGDAESFTSADLEAMPCSCHEEER